MKYSILAGLAALTLLGLPALVHADETILPVNDVITARGGAAPLLLWRTNNDVKVLRAAHVTDTQLLPALLSDGLLLMANRAKILPDAKTLNIRLLYSNTGGVDPRYGLPVMAGIQRIATITAPVSVLRSGNINSLAKALRDGTTPTLLKIEIEAKNFSPPPEQ
jgi:hypothetical protein